MGFRQLKHVCQIRVFDVFQRWYSSVCRVPGRFDG